VRIISQDGTMDVPYEKVILYVGKSYDSKRGKVDKVIARGVENDDYIPIGTYKDSKDAKFVMEWIRDCYSGGSKCFCMPTEDELLMVERSK